MARPFKCPYCGNQETVGKGRRRTKSMGDRCIRLCKGCGRKFTPKNQRGPEAPASTPVVPATPVEELVVQKPSMAVESIVPPLEKTAALPSEPAGQLEKSLSTNDPGN